MQKDTAVKFYLFGKIKYQSLKKHYSPALNATIQQLIGRGVFQELQYCGTLILEHCLHTIRADLLQSRFL
jgi:hypothetical protein